MIISRNGILRMAETILANILMAAALGWLLVKVFNLGIFPATFILSVFHGLEMGLVAYRRRSIFERYAQMEEILDMLIEEKASLSSELREHMVTELDASLVRHENYNKTVKEKLTVIPIKEKS